MASNKALGQFSFEARDKTWVLHYSINAICAIEAQLGPGVQLERVLQDNPSMSIIRTIFWGGLIQHHPQVRLEDAGDLMDAIGFTRAAALLGEALTAAFVQTKAPAGPLAGTTPAPTGSIS